ncbi:hypothetical protein [Frateuria aurantia]|uniref:Uncharacterized protein n=1 Tax=Frateuria aurantia (strain ATCC 33424 / DSM 6220 / KCTC 2777 / LMG 1558 / NBRC 3245 / NCIMB 13370) TaxID=767434 RepID=H8L1T8_FRAAD|nr:hypothetical protein [Frateuria aurantia]AFC86349.1 hypothetical protein Fraau_1960 [Frateuria aurantia DSM 6220]
MDFASITGLASSTISTITGAKDLISAAVDMRDAAKQSAELVKANDLLLKAQQSLLTYTGQLMELQGKYLDACEELRKLREAEADRGRYTLFEVSPGAFAYRAYATPRLSTAGEPLPPEPEHYVCQPCYDRGIKSVLQRFNHYGSIYLRCSICKQDLPTGRTEPFGGI